MIFNMFNKNDAPPHEVKMNSLSAAVVPGFTLIECLIAVAVISLGCLAAIYLQITAMGAGQLAERLTVGTFLAESEYERLRSMDKAGLAAEPDDTEGNPEYLNQDGVVCVPNTTQTPTCEQGPAFPYQRHRIITENIPTSNSSWLVIVVQWDGSNGLNNLTVEGPLTDFTF